MILKKKYSPIIVFWIMILIYSLFSSMMPPSFGIAELIVGILLVYLAVNRGTAHLVTQINPSDQAPPFPVRLSFVVLLITPLFTAAITQNEIRDILRDILPLMFFFVPILFYSRLQQFPIIWVWNFSYALAFVGLVMSIRHFSGAENAIADLGSVLILGGKVSLAHDPAVLFSAIFLAGIGVHKLFKGNLLTASVYLLLSGIPIAAIFAVAARAPFGLLVIALLVIVYFNATANTTVKLLSPLVVMCLVSVVFYIAGDTIERSYELMLLKQQNYGISSRDLEFMAVIDNITDPFLLLFGEGWGGLISNPIGGIWSFVHNIGAYFLFKSGITGLVMLLVYLFWVAKCCLLAVKKSNNDILVILIAAVPPILVNGLLEVGYKTLTFGLLLALIVSIYLVHHNANNVQGRRAFH